MTASKRKLVPGWALFTLVGACLLVSLTSFWCARTIQPFLPTYAPENFPDTDIVYTGGSGVGFVNSDGTGVTAVSLVYGYTDFVGTSQSPLITGDGRIILVTHTSVPGYPGKIFAVPAGEKPVDCRWHGTIQIAADGSHILVAEIGGGIHKYLPADCGTDNPPEKEYNGISGALSPDEQYVAEVRGGGQGLEPYIVIRHLETGEERNLGNGNFPVWSREGRWLAYTGADGIYLLQNRADADPKRLVPLEGPEPSLSVPVPVYDDYRFDEYYPPSASWSPDGKWLVYHVYSENLVAPDAGAWAGHYSIFKVNVNTGETMKLLDGGYSPSWRWHVDEP